jgi:hypothetical protein
MPDDPIKGLSKKWGGEGFPARGNRGYPPNNILITNNYILSTFPPTASPPKYGGVFDLPGKGAKRLIRQLQCLNHHRRIKPAGNEKQDNKDG